MPSLGDFRATLDNLDTVLLRLLAERFRITKRVGEYQRRHGIAARDEAGEKRQLQRTRELAEPLGVDPEVAQQIFQIIFDAASPARDTRSPRDPRRNGSKTDEAQVRDYQASLDNLDAALLRLLSERFRTTEKVGFYKHQHDLPARDEAREKAQLQRARSLATSVGLDPEIAQRIYRTIFDAVVANHQQIREQLREQRPTPK